MKFEVEFVNKYQDGTQRNITLTFGETDIESVAKKCFNYGKSQNFDEIIFRRIKKP